AGGGRRRLARGSRERSVGVAAAEHGGDRPGPAASRARLLRELFRAVARPIATARTGGAFLGGLRLMAIDGTTLAVADTPETDRDPHRWLIPGPDLSLPRRTAARRARDRTARGRVRPGHACWARSGEVPPDHLPPR